MTNLKKFKRLNWLEFNFLLIGHTVRFKLSTRQRDQRDKITKKTGMLELSPFPGGWWVKVEIKAISAQPTELELD